MTTCCAESVQTKPLSSIQLNSPDLAKYLKKDCLMKLFYAFVISNFSYCATVWHFCSKSSTIKMEKIQKAALRVVFNDYTADYNELLSLSERFPLLIVRLRALLIEVFKCVRELNPVFMNMLFSLTSKALVNSPQTATSKHHYGYTKQCNPGFCISKNGTIPSAYWKIDPGNAVRADLIYHCSKPNAFPISSGKPLPIHAQYIRVPVPCFIFLIQCSLRDNFQ